MTEFSVKFVVAVKRGCPDEKIEDPYKYNIRWNAINEMILKTVKGTKEWATRGYDGISEIIQKHLGFSVMRDESSWVIFVFPSEEDFLVFALRHGIP